MSEVPQPSQHLCLACGTLGPATDSPIYACTACGYEQDRAALLHMYFYAAEAYYYGHQYRLNYEAASPSSRGTRFHLGFGGEELAWTMLAALSGVIGNATYDTLKAVVRRIREQSRASTGNHSGDLEPLADLSDEELAKLVDSARHYYGDLDGLTLHVRSAIVEEIAVDTMSHNPALGAEMQRLMRREKIKPKDRRRFVELLRLAIAQRRQKMRQNQSHYASLWSRLPRRP